MGSSPNEDEESMHFVEAIVAEDVEQGTFEGNVHTRFPPEPNGYLHIGHAKAICLDFGMAEAYDGLCNLRFDDTNPMAEEHEYVQAIKEDVGWLGFDWGEREYFASDYFEQLYQWALQLIEQGDAYVCDLSPEEVDEYRGTPTEPGKESPYRDRPTEENLDLFRRMRDGEFEEGSRTLRARIDMAHPNILMRDPVMYRILKQSHHRTGSDWCIYPTYDWAHGQCDSIEGITHSLCTLEFENHRPLYDWFLERLGVHHPKQIECARLNLTNTVMSKRRLRRMVEEDVVNGWDDPRMPTLKGLRRRGYTPAAIRDFCDRISVSKTESVIDMAFLEHVLREHLNKEAPRKMGVLRPLKVVVENYPEGKTEQMEFINNPEDPSAGTRTVPFTREIYIERTDFMEEPVSKFYRLAPGREVRLRYAYFITCEEVVKDPDTGQVVELRCSHDPQTRGGDAPDGRSPKATLHWVSATESLPAEVRWYADLLEQEEEGEEKDLLERVNPDSVEVLAGCRVEPSLRGAEPGYRCQFERKGYFCVDPDSTEDRLVFNLTVPLRDRWRRIQKRRQQQG